MTADDRPLAGVRVVDLTVTLPGPFATQTLRRLGAGVTRIEPPGGDPLRVASPAAYAWLAAGKQSVVLDLKDPAGRARALDLCAAADVVIEGWRPGVADRLGVGFADVHARNPAAVYCSLSGFDPGGPLAGRAGHDITYTAAAGALDLLRPGGMPVGDLAGGGAAATRILAELLRARATGTGRHAHVTIAGTLADWVAAIGGAGHRRLGAVLDSPHYRGYRLRDGARVVIGVVPGEQRFWAGLVTALGRPEWAGMTDADRRTRSQELTAYLTGAFGALTADEVSDRLGAVDTGWIIARDPGDPAL